MRKQQCYKYNNCLCNYNCKNILSPCYQNDTCTQCPTSATGPQGTSGGLLSFADFYALMPPDNS